MRYGARVSILALAAGGLLVTGVLTAQAASQTVLIVASGTTGCASAFCFQPAQLSVTAGDSVTWTNATTVAHTVTRCTAASCSGQDGGTGGDTLDSGGNLSGSGPYAGGGTYTHSFSANSAGTYFYYCAIHGYSVMHGEVDVASAQIVPELPRPGLLLAAGAAVVLTPAVLLRWRGGQPSSQRRKRSTASR
jgi:plastocyanin